jgi:hypothetical protein
MHKFAFWIVVVLSAIAAISSTRADDGWKMPNLNPFGKKAGPPTSARVAESSSGGWKLPSLWPASKPAAAARKPSQPSAWQKMTTSTRKFWSTTADTLNPFNDAEHKPQQPISATGANSYFSQTANRKTTKSKSNSFLPSWTSGQDEAPVREQKTGVNGFLSQPRPEF